MWRKSWTCPYVELSQETVLFLQKNRSLKSEERAKNWSELITVGLNLGLGEEGPWAHGCTKGDPMPPGSKQFEKARRKSTKRG